VTHPSQPNYIALWPRARSGPRTTPARRRDRHSRPRTWAAPARRPDGRGRSYCETPALGREHGCASSDNLYQRKHHPCPTSRTSTTRRSVPTATRDRHRGRQATGPLVRGPEHVQTTCTDCSPAPQATPGCCTTAGDDRGGRTAGARHPDLGRGRQEQLEPHPHRVRGTDGEAQLRSRRRGSRTTPSCGRSATRSGFSSFANAASATPRRAMSGPWLGRGGADAAQGLEPDEPSPNPFRTAMTATLALPSERSGSRVRGRLLGPRCAEPCSPSSARDVHGHWDGSRDDGVTCRGRPHFLYVRSGARPGGAETGAHAIAGPPAGRVGYPPRAALAPARGGPREHARGLAAMEKFTLEASRAGGVLAGSKRRSAMSAHQLARAARRPRAPADGSHALAIAAGLALGHAGARRGCELAASVRLLEWLVRDLPVAAPRS